ncbi:hypothetical protein J6590_003431 [Homalodisca vitripennis]|nr:hypothetical protein J6590_003431 [Homalodisca vitripennis]
MLRCGAGQGKDTASVTIDIADVQMSTAGRQQGVSVPRGRTRHSSSLCLVLTRSEPDATKPCWPAKTTN